ncbi:MAG: chromosome partitioning protein ParB, partial [Sulfitobacter sp.]
DKSGLRKAEIAKAMEQAFCDTPQEAAGLTAQAAAKTSRWLPDGMAVGGEETEQTQPDTVEVDAVVPADDADALPAFMSDAA